MDTAILTNAGSFGSVAGIILFAIFGLAFGSIIYSKRSYEVNLTTPIILGFVINMSVLVYRIVYERYLVADEITWHNEGIRVAEAFLGHSDMGRAGLTSGKEGYSWLVGGIYAVTGPVPMLLIILNIVLYALLVPILAVITGILAKDLRFTEMQGTRAVTFAVYFIALTPVIIFWSPRMLREVISMFLISLSVLCLLLFYRDKRLRYLFGMASAVTLMVAIRADIGGGLGASLVAGVIFISLLRFQGWITRLALSVPLLALFIFMAWNYVNSRSDLNASVAAQQNIYLGEANSAYSGLESLRGADSIIDIILFNLPKVLLGPFPNELNSSMIMLFAAFSNIFWLSLLLLASRIFILRRFSFENKSWSNGQASRRWHGVLLIAILLAAFIGMLSMSSGNYGLMIRMRLMPFVLLIPLAAVGYAVFREKIELRTD